MDTETLSAMKACAAIQEKHFNDNLNNKEFRDSYSSLDVFLGEFNAYHNYGPFHEDGVLESALEYFCRSFPDKDTQLTLIFPCCGLAISEITMTATLVKYGYNIKEIVLMDHVSVDQSEFWRCGTEYTFMHSFVDLAKKIQNIDSFSVVFGFNAINDRPHDMKKWEGLSDFLLACKNNSCVHQKYIMIRQTRSNVDYFLRRGETFCGPTKESGIIMEREWDDDIIGEGDVQMVEDIEPCGMAIEGHVTINAIPVYDHDDIWSPASAFPLTP